MKVRIGLNLGEPHTLFRLHSAPRLTDREGQHLLGLGNAPSPQHTPKRTLQKAEPLGIEQSSPRQRSLTSRI